MAVRIVHLSDPHFGALDDAVAAAAPAAVRARSPDVVVVTGDLTMSGRRKEFAAARRFLDALPAPLVVIPGNHDIPKVNQLFDRLFHPFRRYQKFVGANLEPALDLDGVRVVGLNSSRPFGPYLDWSRGRLSEQQLDGLPARFAGAHHGALRVLGIHHPTIAPPENRRDLIVPLARVKAAIAAARVDLVLGGHFHQSYLLALACHDGRAAWRAVVSQVSTVTSTRLQGEPNGFHVLVLERDALQAERLEWDGAEFRERETLRFARDPATGWELRPA